MSNCLNTIEQRKRTVARHSCIMGVGVKWFGTRMGSGGYGQLRVRVFSWPPPTPTPDPPAAGLLLLLQRLQFCIAQNRRGRLAMRRSLTAKEPCCCDRRCWGTGVSPAPLQGSQRDKGNGLVAGVSGRRAATAIEDEHHMYL